MKKKYSRIILIVIALGFFTINMVLPSFDAQACPQKDKCFWQDYDGNAQSGFTQFCGFEAGDEECSCGSFK